MAFGLGRLRLSPEAFWRLTPREVAVLIGGGAPPPPGRAWLDALMQAHPDTRGHEND
jgi:uncharacterized phage protein (TIGR02216 family)